MADLGIICMDNCKEFGERVIEGVQAIRKTNDNFRVTVEMSRFGNGEGKSKIKSTVRNKDLYIVTDVGNYNMSYPFYGRTHYVAPDEHYVDIKRVISAASGSAAKITVVMPLLYQSRQHKRRGRESLDCAIALQELERLYVGHIITFDAHDRSVCNSIPTTSFTSPYPTSVILDKLAENNKRDGISFIVSPDLGAAERAKYYAEKLGRDMGIFYKRRDLSRVVDGKNPIVAHEYMGADVKGKNALIVDDMIASGGSMLDVAKYLKEHGANEVYIATTFALFTEGISNFIDAYEKGYFDELYTTNLSYVPKEIREQPWYKEVDCSFFLAEIIDKLNRNESIEDLIAR